MEKNSEFGVLIPIRNFIILQRLPIRAIRTLVRAVPNRLQKFIALRIILGTGALPDLIELLRRLRFGRLGLRKNRSGTKRRGRQQPYGPLIITASSNGGGQHLIDFGSLE